MKQPVTFWETGYHLYLIPYKMKSHCNQQPRDILPGCRSSWYQVYDLINLNLHAGEWCEEEIDIQDYLNQCKEKELQIKRYELNRNIKETISGVEWLYSETADLIKKMRER